MPLPVRRRETSDVRPLRRWEPFRELEDLHSQMGELMQSVWAPGGVGDGLWTPMVDIEETEDAWILEAELPGIDKKDVNVEMRDSDLVISGEIKERERKGILRRRTRRTGRFDFRVTLPGEVKADDIDAKLENGVLTVRVPKADEARARRIEVKEGQG